MKIQETIKKYSKSKLAKGSATFMIMKLIAMIFGIEMQNELLNFRLKTRMTL